MVALLLAVLSPVRAGGPLELDSENRPLRWDPATPVRYLVDRGPLGPHSHDAAVAMARDAAAMWESVPTARLRFQAAGELSRDITGSSVLTFLNGVSAGFAVVLFDHDGSIVETLLGEGADGLGVGGPLRTAWRQPTITASYLVLNGASQRDYSEAYARGTAVHEWGHAVGLDHSQLNDEQVYDGDPTNNALAPMMSYSHGPGTGAHLHADDRAWFSWLYPADGDEDTGSIRGRVLLPDRKTGLRGINVIARRMGDPQVTAVAGVSGGLWNGRAGGSLDPGRLGEFLIPRLPPGAYTVELQELADEPEVILAPGALPGGPKFWREGSSPQDLPTSSSPVIVVAGQEVTGIDIVVNAEDLGEPVAVTEVEPNALPRGQSVTLPALISGEVEDADGAGAPVEDEELPQALDDVYAIRVREPTLLTAVLSTPGRGIDLDLYLVEPDGAGFTVVARANENGTPPEILQVLVAAGRYFVGVRRGGGRGSSYTLSVMATPAPEPQVRPLFPDVSYLIIGDVTPTSAILRWHTMAEVPSVVWYHTPQRELGSTRRTRDHAITLTDLTERLRTRAEVLAGIGGTFDSVRVPFTAAAPPVPDGAPRLVLGSSTRLLEPDYAEVEVRFNNPGDGEALDVRIEQIVPASGWFPVSLFLRREALPLPMEVGRIGAGGAGVFLVRLVRWSGTAEAKVTVRGTFTDASGAALKF